MMEKGAIFPLFYLPPVELFSRLLEHNPNLLLEKCENFPKQTFRNRASIHSPNGQLDLIIPVVRGSKVHTLIKDVRISYDFNWQRSHWLSIQTSYHSSAYFEFYEDDFAPFYEKKCTFLFDYTEELFQMLIRLLKLNLSYSYTKDYEKHYTDMEDYRFSISPKQKEQYSGKTYFQVFEERNGFIPNLSIVDLLFNQGPQSNNFLSNGKDQTY
ncbi:MAG: WbqC family protein [Daejeonella sp.]